MKTIRQVFSGFALSTLFWATPGFAQSKPADESHRVRFSLVYAAPSGCPTEQDFRALVAARVGYDPFVDQADHSLRVELSRIGDNIQGEWSIGGGEAPRRLQVPEAECAELGATFALSVSVTIDHIAQTQQERTAQPSRAPEPRPVQTLDTRLSSPPKNKPKKAPTSPEDATRLVASASVHGSAGLVPDLTLGVATGVAVRFRLWSLGVEGRAELPRSKLDEADSGVRGSLVGGAPVLCVYLTPGFACFLSTLGAFRGEGVGVVGVDRASTFYANLGARAGAELKLSSALRAQALVEAFAPLTRTSLRAGDRTVWSTPTLAGTLGLGLSLELR